MNLNGSSGNNYTTEWKVSGTKVFPSKLDRFPTSIEAIEVSKDLSGSRWALFGETISVNYLYYFVSVNELG